MTPLVAFGGASDFNELVEGIVADNEKDVVYIAGEDTSIYRYQTLNGVIQNAGRVTVGSVGDGNLTADIEGLTMYYASDGKGYLIASSQGSSQYAVYEREFSGTAANAYIKNFSISWQRPHRRYRRGQRQSGRFVHRRYVPRPQRWRIALEHQARRLGGRRQRDRPDPDDRHQLGPATGRV